MADKIDQRRRNSEPEYRVSAVETNSQDIVELISQAHVKALIIKYVQHKDSGELDAKEREGKGLLDLSGFFTADPSGQATARENYR